LESPNLLRFYMVRKRDAITQEMFDDIIKAYESTDIPQSEVDEKQEFPASKASKHYLGDDLYIIFSNQKQPQFKCRIRVNQRETMKVLGTYNEMSLDQARIEAGKWRSEVAIERRKTADAKVRKMMQVVTHAKTKKKALPCFKNLGDARKFIIALKTAIRGGVDTEIYLALWLLLLNPTRTKELLSAKWADFSHTADVIWAVKTPLKKNTPSKYTELISRCSCDALHQLESLLPNKYDINEYLFPTLANLKKSEFNKKIKLAILQIWGDYVIDPHQFKYFYKSIACDFSNFHPDFIERTITHYGSTEYWINNRQQYNALVNWWGEQLDREANHFNAEKQGRRDTDVAYGM
jgi:integrase